MTALTITDLKQKSPKWKKLQKLWADIEKKQERNARCEAKMVDYLKVFHEHAEAAEHKLCEARVRLIEHLLKFTTRKTIKGYRREALYDWIDAEIETLNENPFKTIDTTPLVDAYHQAIMSDEEDLESDPEMEALEIELVREAFKNFFGEDIPLPKEDILKFAKAPEDFHAFCQDFADKKQYEPRHQEADIEDEYLSEPSTDKLFQADRIGKLYRQLAKVLHPDKEQDPEQKHIKKALMQQLSQAKKDNDIFSLFTLAQTWLPDFEITLDQTTKSALEKSLKQKIKSLNEEFDELRNSPTKQNLVWMKFGESNLKKATKSMIAYAERITERSLQLSEFIVKFKTVKDMQDELKQRDEQQRLFQGYKNLL